MKGTNNLTEGSVLKTLIMFALPFLFSNFMQSFYGAVDLLVIGRFGGTSAISAVNIGSQIMQITNCILGISIGTTVVLGQHIGSKNHTGAAYTVGNTIIIFGIFAVIITPIMIWQTGNLVHIMDTPAEAVNETMKYVAICSAGLPFVIAYNVISSVLRGMGNSKVPMYFVGISCIVNIIGDLILTGMMHKGVAGAAAATVSAQCVSSVLGFIYLKKYGFEFNFNKSYIRFQKTEAFKIITIGLPIALQDTLISVSFMILTVIANRRGLIASSAVGVVEKLIMFMFLVPSSMLSAITTITAQNIGAGNKARAILSLKYGIIITAVFGIIVCGTSQIIPTTLTGIFTKDSDVIAAAGEYLRTYSIDCILVAVTFCLNGYLCGIGKSAVTFIHNTISIFTVRIPVAFVLSAIFPNTLLPMGLASPAGSLLSIIILSIYFFTIKGSLKDEQSN